MSITSPAIQALDDRQVPYRVFTHIRTPRSLEEAAHEREQSPDQIIRSILFRKGRDEFFMVLIAGPGQISWRRLRAHLSVSRISMATEAEVEQVTGFAVGTVSPLGLPHPLQILADVSVFQPEEISIGCGVRGAAIIMKSSDLKRALGRVEIGLFAL